MIHILPPDVITLPCACGVAITASRTAPFLVVYHHNRGARHRRWWESVRVEWQGVEAV